MPEVSTPVSFENTEIAFSYKSNKELKKAAWLFKMMNQGWLVKIGTRLTPLAFKLRLPIKSIVRSTIFEQFCGGETLEKCVPTTEKLSKYQVETILDYGVEAKLTDEEFDKSMNEFLKGISFAKQNHHVPFISVKVTGVGAFDLLEKLHSKKTLTDAEVLSWNLVKGRMHRIAKAAHDANIGVMIDAEETWIQDPIDELTMELMKFYNKESPVIYNTFQLYRTDRLDFLKSSFEKSKAENFILGAKLVRGAYMEKERRRAGEMNYSSPIQPDKISADRDYNAALEFCFENMGGISFCVASHNEYSSMLAAEIAEKKNIVPSHRHLHFSQLYGMSDNITFNLAHAGYNVTKYVPYGPVKDVVPYLMRRAQENTSVAGQSSRELLLIRKELKRRRL